MGARGCKLLATACRCCGKFLRGPPPRWAARKRRVMSFRLFGVNVEIQLFFWVTAVFFGFPYVQNPAAPRGALVAWVLIVFVSVLVHEYGHAFAVKRHGIEPEIALHGMGGVT